MIAFEVVGNPDSCHHLRPLRWVQSPLRLKTEEAKDKARGGVRLIEGRVHGAEAKLEADVELGAPEQKAAGRG
jgi:hypothetical protein